MCIQRSIACPKDMVYYRDSELIIRDMKESDAQIITDEEIAQGWDADIGKYLSRIKDRSDGRAIALVAELRDTLREEFCPENGRAQVAGYINIYPNCSWGAFGNMGYPEIVDFGVLEKYRKRGIGSRLMDAAEKIAAEYSDTVYLGVGLHSGYGSAQRMYVKRGYVPDGGGVWYGEAVCEPYAACRNDDDLVLYFSKRLR